MKNESRKRFWIIFVAVFSLVALTTVGAYAAFQSDGESDAATVAQADESETPAETSIYDRGVLVTSVDGEKPAADAGVRRGTIILAVDGVAVDTPEALIDAISQAGPGATVTLTVLNGPEPEDLAVTLAEDKPLLGIRLFGMERFGRMEAHRDAIPALPFSPEERMPFADGEAEIEAVAGALITTVGEETPAAAAGLEPGDIITAVDGATIDTVDALVALIGESAPGDRLTLSLDRDGETKSAIIVLGENPDDATRGFMGVTVAPAVPSIPFPSQGFEGEAIPFAFGGLESLFPEGFDLEQLFPGGLFSFGDGEALTPEQLEQFFSGELSTEELEQLFPDGFGFEQMLPDGLFGFGPEGEALTPEQLEALLSGELTEEELEELFPNGVPSFDGLDQLLPPEFFAPFAPGTTPGDVENNDA